MEDQDNGDIYANGFNHGKAEGRKEAMPVVWLLGVALFTILWLVVQLIGK